VLCEGVPGPGAVKASGSVSEIPMTKGCNDVAVDRFHQAGLVVSLLRSAFRFLYVGIRTRNIVRGITL
jgi:hypothetical protein